MMLEAFNLENGERYLAVPPVTVVEGRNVNLNAYARFNHYSLNPLLYGALV